MRTALKLSLLLNLGLAGCLAWVLVHTPDSGVRTAVPTAADSTVPWNVGTSQTPREPPSTVSQPGAFRWSQLESTNYSTYIANLRAIGCPEQTIRDIVSADLHAVYATRGEALEKKISAEGDSIIRLAARHEIEIALDALKSEEASALEALLCPVPNSAQASAQSPPASSLADARVAGSASISVPLVFQDIDSASVKLNDRQLQAIADLKQRFTDEIGGPDQDPNDPAYQQRWLQAQPEIDNMMRGMVGENGFEDYQIAARARRQQAGAAH